MSGPPFLWRFILNPLRAWLERDDRLLVEQWREAYKPDAKKVIRAWPGVSSTRQADRIYRVSGRR